MSLRPRTPRRFADAVNVLIGVATDLELKFRVTFRLVADDLVRHRLGRLLRDRAIKRDPFLRRSAKQLVHGKTGCFAENVPARDVDRRLHIGMTAQNQIHVVVEHAEVCRIEADDLRADFLEAGAHPVCVGRKIGRSKRTAFGVTDQASVSLHCDDGRIEHFDKIPI